MHVTNVLIIIISSSSSSVHSDMEEEQCGKLTKFALTCCDITPTDQLIVFEIIRYIMTVVWICVYPASLRMIIDSDTTWVKFTSLLALFQHVGPIM